MPSTLKRHGYSLLTTTTHEPTSPFYFNATIHITPKLQELELFYGGNCVPCHFCYQRYLKIERRSNGMGMAFSPYKRRRPRRPRQEPSRARQAGRWCYSRSRKLCRSAPAVACGTYRTLLRAVGRAARLGMPCACVSAYSRRKPS